MKTSISFLSAKKVLKCVKDLSITTCDYIHVDFIDGKFVVGKKIPFRKLKKIPKLTSKRLDIHLMTDKLNKYIKKFASMNAEYITFHYEATKNHEKYIKLIHSYGLKCGIAINPDTDYKVLEPFMDMIDLILVMGVNPGYGGQAFIPEVSTKLKELRSYILENKYSIIVSVDGGVNETTIEKIENYTDMVVAGSYVTNSDNYQEQIDKLK